MAFLVHFSFFIELMVWKLLLVG